MDSIRLSDPPTNLQSSPLSASSSSSIQMGEYNPQLKVQALEVKASEHSSSQGGSVFKGQQQIKLGQVDAQLDIKPRKSRGSNVRKSQVSKRPTQKMSEPDLPSPKLHEDKNFQNQTSQMEQQPEFLKQLRKSRKQSRRQSQYSSTQQRYSISSKKTLKKIQRQLSRFQQRNAEKSDSSSFTGSFSESDLPSVKGMSRTQKAKYKLDKATNQAKKMVDSLKQTLKIAEKNGVMDDDEEEEYSPNRLRYANNVLLRRSSQQEGSPALRRLNQMRSSQTYTDEKIMDLLQLKNKSKKQEPLNYFDVFDKLFKQNLRRYISVERRKLKTTADQVEKEMFQFSKRRIKEIQEKVENTYFEQKKIDMTRVTRLKNDAATYNIGQMQREMLQGKYSIILDETLPFAKKIEKMANEPVAFQLYKKRHFERLKEQKLTEQQIEEQLLKERAANPGADIPAPLEKETGNKRDFRNILLRVVNAKIIGKPKFMDIVERAAGMGWALDHIILNLPPILKDFMRNKIIRGIKNKEKLKEEDAKRLGAASKKTFGRMMKKPAGPSAFSPQNQKGGSPPRGQIVTLTTDQDEKDSSDDEKQTELDPIYTTSAMNNTVLIYEDAQNKITPQRLVKLVMKQIRQELNIQRAQIKKQITKKRATLNLSKEAKTKISTMFTEHETEIWKGGSIDLNRFRRNQRAQTQISEDALKAAGTQSQTSGGGAAPVKEAVVSTQISMRNQQIAEDLNEMLDFSMNLASRPNSRGAVVKKLDDSVKKQMKSTGNFGFKPMDGGEPMILPRQGVGRSFSRNRYERGNENYFSHQSNSGLPLNKPARHDITSMSSQFRKKPVQGAISMLRNTQDASSSYIARAEEDQCLIGKVVGEQQPTRNSILGAQTCQRQYYNEKSSFPSNLLTLQPNSPNYGAQPQADSEQVKGYGQHMSVQEPRFIKQNSQSKPGLSPSGQVLPSTQFSQQHYANQLADPQIISQQHLIASDGQGIFSSNNVMRSNNDIISGGTSFDQHPVDSSSQLEKHKSILEQGQDLPSSSGTQLLGSASVFSKPKSDYMKHRNRIYSSIGSQQEYRKPMTANQIKGFARDVQRSVDASKNKENLLINKQASLLRKLEKQKESLSFNSRKAKIPHLLHKAKETDDQLLTAADKKILALTKQFSSQNPTRSVKVKFNLEDQPASAGSSHNLDVSPPSRAHRNSELVTPGQIEFTRIENQLSKLKMRKSLATKIYSAIKKQQLFSVIKNCDSFNQDYSDYVSNLDKEMNRQGIWDQELFHIQSQLRELEGIEPQLLGSMLDYRQNIEQEEQEEAREVTIEFKKDTLNPDRPIIAWEKAINMKKRNQLAKQTRMINKGKGFK